MLAMPASAISCASDYLSVVQEVESQQAQRLQDRDHFRVRTESAPMTLHRPPVACRKPVAAGFWCQHLATVVADGARRRSVGVRAVS